MERPDATLIRDTDLKAELEAIKGSFLYDVQVSLIVEKQRKRDKDTAARTALAALPRSKRLRVKTAVALSTTPVGLADMRHIHSVLAIASLPYRRLPPGTQHFARKQGRMAIDVAAGRLRDPVGNLVEQPIPFGPKARLILMHLCSEAIRQKSPTIDLAETFTAFVRDLGFPDSGGKRGTLTAFKEQLNALAACTMQVSVWTGDRVRNERIVPIRSMELWLATDPHQKSLWPSTLTFSLDFYESLKQHALPLNINAVRAFAGSARKLDLYFWLGYRMANLDKPLAISWDALTQQFGEGYAVPRQFRAAFSQDLADMKDVFPTLPTTLTTKGLLLSPAKHDVLALRTPKVGKKQR
jgi:hypothetical protein